jgi:hypothetical protein
VARLASGLAVGLIIGFTAAWVAMAVYELATGQLVHPLAPGPEPLFHHHHIWMGH